MEVHYDPVQAWSPDRGTYISDGETRIQMCLKCEGTGEVGEDEANEEDVDLPEE